MTDIISVESKMHLFYLIFNKYFSSAQGTSTPQNCPPGTYNDQTGLQAESDCKSCTGGYYCPNYGMTSVPTTNKCTAGKL